MPLPMPNLDDRTFEDLMAAARQKLAGISHDQWTDLSPGDPGIVLLELFAYLTEMMIYRLNQLPEKVYVALLNLMGIRRRPPTAAKVRLLFTMPDVAARDVIIQRRTQFASKELDASGQPVVFRTAQQLIIAAGKGSAEVDAYNYEYVEGEFVGINTGLPWATFRVKHPPILDAPSDEEKGLIVGVEMRTSDTGRQDERVTRELGGKTYQIWRQVDSFAEEPEDPYVYTVDRIEGALTLAWQQHRAMASRGASDPRSAPAVGQEVRAWYWRSGGAAGNVAAHSLDTVWVDPDTGVRLEVANPDPAGGGYDAESVPEALQRGPQELYSLDRGAITGRDFERLAMQKGVARAKAMAKADLWDNARAGTVEVRLVPDLPDLTQNDRGEGRVTAAELHQHETPTALEACRARLNARRPLGTICDVEWARYKMVRVEAKIVVRQEEGAQSVKDHVKRRLHEHINPLPTENGRGWPFGKDLWASDVYNIALLEPGVSRVYGVRLAVDQAPQNNVCTLESDFHQTSTWYAGSDSTVFRSTNDGDGWEAVKPFEGERVRLVRAHPQRPGRIVVLTVRNSDGGLRLHLSDTYGETWDEPDGKPWTGDFAPSFGDGSPIKDAADVVWSPDESGNTVLIATDKGLCEVDLQNRGAHLLNPDGAAYAVAAVTFGGRQWVAAVTPRGVCYSENGGEQWKYANRRLEDIQKLAFQTVNSKIYLWAGTAAAGGEDGKGCLRLPLGTGAAADWELLGAKWAGGSCNQLAFLGTTAVAATHHQGVLVLDTEAQPLQWRAPEVAASGLPPRDHPGPFQPVVALATNRRPVTPVIMASVTRDVARPEGEGIYRCKSRDGRRYEFVSGPESAEVVTIPDNWLFISGQHDVQVVEE